MSDGKIGPKTGPMSDDQDRASMSDDQDRDYECRSR